MYQQKGYDECLERNCDVFYGQSSMQACHLMSNSKETDDQTTNQASSYYLCKLLLLYKLKAASKLKSSYCPFELRFSTALQHKVAAPRRPYRRRVVLSLLLPPLSVLHTAQCTVFSVRDCSPGTIWHLVFPLKMDQELKPQLGPLRCKFSTHSSMLYCIQVAAAAMSSSVAGGCHDAGAMPALSWRGARSLVHLWRRRRQGTGGRYRDPVHAGD